MSTEEEILALVFELLDKDFENFLYKHQGEFQQLQHKTKPILIYDHAVVVYDYRIPLVSKYANSVKNLFDKAEQAEQLALINKRRKGLEWTLKKLKREQESLRIQRLNAFLKDKNG